MIKLLQKYQAVIFQFSRFLGIGFLNAAVDFAVFNILIAATGIAAGTGASVLKIVSFVVAVVHSYYWNKYWAFQNSQEGFLKLLFKSIIAGVTGIAVIALVITGAGKKLSTAYFLIIFLAMFLIETGLWFWFKLGKSSKRDKLSSGEFSRFATVSIIGAFLGAVIIWYITTYIPIPRLDRTINEQLWANLANVAASGLVLVWNFFGYKLFVFKR